MVGIQDQADSDPALENFGSEMGSWNCAVESFQVKESLSLRRLGFVPVSDPSVLRYAVVCVVAIPTHL